MFRLVSNQEVRCRSARISQPVGFANSVVADLQENRTSARAVRDLELQHEPGFVLSERDGAAAVVDAGARVDVGIRGVERLAARRRCEDVSEALRRLKRAARVLPVGEGSCVELRSVDAAKARWERPLDNRLVIADDRLPRQTDGRDRRRDDYEPLRRPRNASLSERLPAAYP
jgi:hypothetical protein